MSTATGQRRLDLQKTRNTLYQLPLNELFELPGRPHVVYQLRSYASTTDPDEAALQARQEIPFLFKAFETGQIGPKRMAKMHGGKPRMATIHEYLDWTVTAQAAETDEELVSNGLCAFACNMVGARPWLAMLTMHCYRPYAWVPIQQIIPSNVTSTGLKIKNALVTGMDVARACTQGCTDRMQNGDAHITCKHKFQLDGRAKPGHADGFGK